MSINLKPLLFISFLYITATSSFGQTENFVHNSIEKINDKIKFINSDTSLVVQEERSLLVGGCNTTEMNESLLISINKYNRETKELASIDDKHIVESELSDTTAIGNLFYYSNENLIYAEETIFTKNEEPTTEGFYYYNSEVISAPGSKSKRLFTLGLWQLRNYIEKHSK